jgi:hypothetical protein
MECTTAFLTLALKNNIAVRNDRRFSERVHYVILTSGHLRSSIVVGWKETMVDHPTCGGAPDGHGSRNLL